MKKELKIRPEARLIKTIGEDLIKNPYAAVVELIKNSYDADSEIVIVSIELTNEYVYDKKQKFLKFTIEDDGEGMSLETIKNTWMVPATSYKVNKQYSSKKKRVVQGKKGIGRYASAILGDFLRITTTDLNGMTSIIEIDWKQFDDGKFLDEINIPYECNRTNLKSGTKIEIYSSIEVYYDEIKQQYQDKINWNKDQNNLLFKELRKLLVPTNDFDSKLIGPMVKVLNRDDMSLLNEIKKQMQSKLVRFFSKNNGFLEQQIVEFFWDHMSKNLPYWDQYTIDEIDLVLLRHTTACLNEKLYVSNSSGKYFNEYHPGEMYIYPTIKDRHHTGDIVKKNDDFFIILTPSCDIVNNKYDYYVLARIINSSCTKESFYPIENFAKIFNNKDKEILEPSICFQDLISVKKEEITEYHRVASISYPFLKDIIARFSRYYARQGSPKIIKKS